MIASSAMHIHKKKCLLPWKLIKLSKLIEYFLLDSYFIRTWYLWHLSTSFIHHAYMPWKEYRLWHEFTNWWTEFMSSWLTCLINIYIDFYITFIFEHSVTHSVFKGLCPKVNGEKTLRLCERECQAKQPFVDISTYIFNA